MPKSYQIDINECVNRIEQTINAAVNSGKGELLHVDDYANLAAAYQAQSLNRIANSLEWIVKSLEWIVKSLEWMEPK